jgi:polar amino acid transport system substrate-binding protein
MCVLLLIFSSYNYSENVIKACGHHDYARWNWLENGKIVGLCADIVTELYSRIGYKVDLHFVGPWKRCQKLVAQGEVDVNICSLKNDLRYGYSVFLIYLWLKMRMHYLL